MILFYVEVVRCIGLRWVEFVFYYLFGKLKLIVNVFGYRCFIDKVYYNEGIDF